MSNKKRIVMIGTLPDTQGGVSAVVGVLRAGGLFERCGVDYLPTHRDGKTWPKLRTALQGWLRYLSFLITRKVALVHGHMASRASFWRKLFFFLPAFFLRVPVVVHLHGGEFQQFHGKESSSWARRLIRFVFEHAARVIVLSESWRTWAQMTFPAARVQVVHNPVAIPAPAPFSARATQTLLFLGRLGKGKGTYDLLEAVARLVGRFPDIRLLLGGDGELEQVQARAAALGIAEKVDLLGWVDGDDKRALLAQTAVYVLPSYNEGLPMSVLEAMAAGLPVVATAVGGIPAAVTDGSEGFLIAAGDIQALADRIARLLEDAELRKLMGERARQRAISTFSMEKIVAQIEDIYRELGVIK